MRLGVVSDIHDHIDNLSRVLERLGDAEVLLCCGDLCAPFMVEELARGFGGPVHVVFGNNDGDRYRIARAARAFDRFHLWGEFAELPAEELDGTSVALHHFPEIGRALTASGGYDLVCWGHSHTWNVRRNGETLGLNPGEVMGRLGPPTFAVYDTATGEVERGTIAEEGP